MTQVAADRIDRIIADYERGALNDASARLEILLAAGEGDVEALLARLTHELREWVFRDVGEARPNEGEIIESNCGTASPGADETDLRSREEVLQRGIIAVRSVAARRRNNVGPHVLLRAIPSIPNHLFHGMPTSLHNPTVNVSTFLMFQDGNAHAAMSFYASVFPGVRIERIERYGPGGPGVEGTVKVAQFDLNGHRLMFSDSFVKHAFDFTPSISLFVDFASAEELDAAFAKLAEGGMVFMPIANYGFSRRFGWCGDRFGITWQLNLPETSAQ